jgi:hypothetical protein
MHTLEHLKKTCRQLNGFNHADLMPCSHALIYLLLGKSSV